VQSGVRIDVRQGRDDVTCTATDGSGNTASCSFTVTVNDTTPPAVACPATWCSRPIRGVYGGGDLHDAGGDRQLPGSHGAVRSGVRIDVRQGRDDGHLHGDRRLGNTASCSFTVTVNDTTPPAVICPAPVSSRPIRECARRR